MAESDLAARLEPLIRRSFGSDAALAEVEALAGDASTRSYARARLRGPGAPATVVVMLLADRGIAMSSDELAVFAEPLRQLPYVNVHEFLIRIGVAVPELYLDASDEGVLLLEDVGSVTLWDAVQGRRDEEVEELFARAIDQLLLLQVNGTARRDDACIAFQQQFDERLFLWEFEHFLEWGLIDRIDGPLPDSETALLRERFTALARYLDRQPRVLNHRDFHGWNLFVRDGGIRVIDFQDALLAPAPYDLATLLGDRVTPEVVHPAARAPPSRLLRAPVGSARRTALERGGALGGLLRLRLAEGVQGRRPLPVSRPRQGQAGLPALPAADAATDRPPARHPARSRRPARRSLPLLPRAATVKAMILAAGFGSRLRPLTDRMPKPLIQVAGRPLIAYPLAVLREAGIRDVLINLHHLGEQIRDALGDGSRFGMSITYSEEHPILDTGGAIKNAQSFLEDGTFVVLNADTVIDLNLAEVVRWHRHRGARATMVLRPDREAARYGVIEVDARGRIRRFLGRPPEVHEPLTALMFAGVHVFEPQVFSYMEEGRFGINARTYPAMLAAGCPLFGYEFHGYWRVLDTHAGLAEGRWELSRPALLAPSRRP